MMPFTHAQFIGIFESYNTAIWPVEIAVYFLAALIVSGLFQQNIYVWGRIILGILGAMWLWTGVFYFLLFFTRVSRAGVLFGTLFFFQGSVIFLNSTKRKKINFHAEASRYDIIGAIFILYAAVIYPVIGSLAGHDWPRGPMFGVTPCPLTIFTFGVLLFVKSRVAASILMIPFLWLIVGTVAAFQFGIYEDFGLPVAGIAGTALLLYRNNHLYPEKSRFLRRQI